MNLTFEIAKRYLFGKKSTNAINLITGISVVGMSIGTVALVLILSVFNGFESLITQFLDKFNPDIKIVPVEGKHFTISDEIYDELLKLKATDAISRSLEEVALFEYESSQEIGVIKGVDDQYKNVTQIDSTIRNGEYRLKDENLDFGIVGAGLARRLSLNMDNPFSELTIYSPRRTKRNPLDQDFKTKSLYPGGIFSVHNENDLEYMICSYELAAGLLETPGEVTALEIKVNKDYSFKKAKKDIQKVVGNGFVIKDRYDQDETYLKIMNIEKWMSFLIVGLTVFIVAFNLIGCLWMIVLDKKQDIAVLKSMGATSSTIQKIFLGEGLLISSIGLCIGFGLSLIMFWFQNEFGLLSMSDGFVVDAYPMELKLSDYIIVAVLVSVIGFLASYLPSLKASKIPAYIRQD